MSKYVINQGNDVGYAHAMRSCLSFGKELKESIDNE